MSDPSPIICGGGEASESVASNLPSSPSENPSQSPPPPPPPREPLHLVMVPLQVQGHINPMVSLAHALVTHHGVDAVSIFANRQQYLRLATGFGHGGGEGGGENDIHIESSTSTTYSLLDGRLRFVWVDDGRWVDKAVPHDFDFKASNIMQGVQDSFVRMEESVREAIPKLSPPATALISSTCSDWVHRMALDLRLPSVLFWTQMAAVFSIFRHTRTALVSRGFFPYDRPPKPHDSLPGDDHDNVVDMISDLPGLPPMERSSFPTGLRVDDVSNTFLSFMLHQFDVLHEYTAVLINSYVELEKETWEALRLDIEPRVPLSFVGPTCPYQLLLDGDPSSNDGVHVEGSSLPRENFDCIEWLDKMPPRSVLYISFGSVFIPPPEDLLAISTAILDLKQPFLWVVRECVSAPSLSDIAPDNFVEDTRSYGLIVPWAPQLHVLSHPSIGAFLSHCGWNSTLESISLGIPIIPYPVMMDQVTNAKFVVDIWKIGLRIKSQIDMIEKKKLEINDMKYVLKVLFHEEEGRYMRKRAEDLRDAARKAIQVGGTSHDHIEKFIQVVRNT